MNSYEVCKEVECGVNDELIKRVIDKTLEMENVLNAEFSIVFIDDVKMQDLNKTYRGIDNTTDVLSFAFEDNESIKFDIRHLGEIFVSIPRMRMQADMYNHSEERELCFLIVHGILHLLGYDHTKSKEEEKKMFSRQELVLDEFEETKRK